MGGFFGYGLSHLLCFELGWTEEVIYALSESIVQ